MAASAVVEFRPSSASEADEAIARWRRRRRMDARSVNGTPNGDILGRMYIISYCSLETPPLVDIIENGTLACIDWPWFKSAKETIDWPGRGVRC